MWQPPFLYGCIMAMGYNGKMKTITPLSREQAILGFRQAQKATAQLENLIRQLFSTTNTEPVDERMIKELKKAMDSGADISEIRNNYIENLLWSHADEVWAILAPGVVDVDFKKREELWLTAILYGNLDSLSTLIKYDTLPLGAEFSENAVKRILSKDDVGMANFLKTHGVFKTYKPETQYKGGTILSTVKSPEMLHFFVDLGFKPDVHDLSSAALLKVSEFVSYSASRPTSNPELLKAFLNAGVKVDEDSRFPIKVWNVLLSRCSLSKADRENQVECAKILLEAGCDITRLETPSLPAMVIMLDAGLTPEQVLEQYKTPWPDGQWDMYEQSPTFSKYDPVLHNSIMSLLFELEERGLDIEKLWDPKMSNTVPYLFAFAKAGIPVSSTNIKIPPEVLAMGEESRLKRRTGAARNKKIGMRL